MGRVYLVSRVVHPNYEWCYTGTGAKLTSRTSVLNLVWFWKWWWMPGPTELEVKWSEQIEHPQIAWEEFSSSILHACWRDTNISQAITQWATYVRSLIYDSNTHVIHTQCNNLWRMQETRGDRADIMPKIRPISNRAADRAWDIAKLDVSWAFHRSPS